MNRILFLIFFFAAIQVNAQVIVKGNVSSNENKNPLIGATIKIKGQNSGTSTDTNGNFIISLRPIDTLFISYNGYQSKQINPPIIQNLKIQLEAISTNLNEVVVSTGYQTLPKERATGSFAKVDNELLNRSVGTNIIDRLKDIVPGLSFNNVGSSKISIRGQSTIYGNAEPLIVIDNFPYEGNLQDINPNDVENITILKDAAAASIWGARAGNGVIVITSKKGKVNKPTQVFFNSNVTIGDIPDLYTANQLSSTDYINIEKRLFNSGYYDAANSTGYQPLTPVVELLYQKKANPAQAITIDAQIESLKQQDVRKDFEKYLYQKSLYQQYSLNLSGGGSIHTYYLSAGYDHNRENLLENEYKRTTLNAGNTFKLLKDKLEVTTGISFINNGNQFNNPGIGISNLTAGNSIYPYARLADDSGGTLSIVKNYGNSFITAAENNGLLNWAYSPLDEIVYADHTSKRNNIRLNSSLKYNILKGLSVSGLYQYGNIATTDRNFRSQNTYFTRDIINRFTQISGMTIVRPVPLGGILDFSEQSSISHNFRSQLDFNRKFFTKHELTAIAGFEVRDTRTENHNYRYYGYNEAYSKSGLVDYIDNTLPYYYDISRKGQIPNADAIGLYNDRFISYYANASYTYNQNITASASARLDQSNLFGVKTNQKGVPLWSIGVSWILSNEDFFKNDIFPYLKLRATYGYNGSVNKSVSAYTTASLTGYYNSFPYSTIINPPNPELRWERVKIFNAGIDFALKENRVKGSIELYHKKGFDLIGDTPFPPSSGVSLFRGNTANTSGKGLELSLNTINLNGHIKWESDFVFSYITESVTAYKTIGTVYNYIQSGLNLPLEGKPLYSLYSYQFAGLDPLTGDPQGYLNDKISKDYTKILNATTPVTMVYGGSKRPTRFGSLRNTFDYKGLSFSFNVVYRLGYYFRKSSIAYGSNYGLSSNNGDYAMRWQKTGDEVNTNVPSIPNTANNNRDALYRYSDILTEQADNIRLQDIRVSYDFSKLGNTFAKYRSVQFYLYLSNIGLMWKKTKLNIDPDNPSVNLPFMTSFGLKVSL